MNITFKGTIYDVPDWAEYIAMDRDSAEIYVYDTQPREAENGNWAVTYPAKFQQVGNFNCMKIAKTETQVEGSPKGNLLAAAPMLYEALEAAVSAMDSVWEIELSVVDAAKAALAAAK